MKKFTVFILFVLLSLSGCSTNIFKRADVNDTPVNVNDRVKKTLKKVGGLDLVKTKKREVLLISHHPMNCGELPWIF